MSKSKRPAIAMSAPVTITAGDSEGDKKSPARFETTFYTGGPVEVAGWDLPVVVDLAGLDRGNVLVANLDHDRTKRVGNFDVTNDGKTLIAHGTATAKTPARDEVIGSALEGYQWQSSLEVNPREIEEVKAGKTVTVNGQSLDGPLYVTRKGVLKGFAFVSHGADDNTTVSIAASAASQGAVEMKAEVKAWAESMGFDVDSLTDEQRAGLEANYAGTNAKPVKAASSSNPFEKRKAEAKRRNEIRAIADKFVERREGDLDYIEAVERMTDHAIEANMTVQDFRNEMYEQAFAEARPTGHPRVQDRAISNRIIQAAICQAGRLGNIENHFTDQELQAAHDRFRGGIGLNQFILLCAEARGYRADSASKVTIDAQRAAFGMPHSGRQIHAAGGFSTIDIATIVGATANKFLMEGWNAMDQTSLQIAKIQPVSNFQTQTTVSLTDSVIFDKVGADGEIKHGTLDELTYTVQADTYARMLAITRKDIINDNLGALTAVPRKLGNGAMKKLNDIFWTEYLGLVGSNFFGSANSNINTGVATMTEAGLDATYVIFKNQTNPDGTPLGVEPRYLLVPTALDGAARRLMTSERLITGNTTTQGDGNIWNGRFTVLSSPYISNSTYTGNTAVGWWMLADPQVLPVICIAALNGRVEPTVETADADFNVLGIQMRGYSDVGVNEQEYRGGVYADGGAS